MPALTTETLARLRAFDTPTICNLIELFEVRPHNTGYMDGRIRAAFPEMPPMVGFAATATFRAAPAGDAPPPLRGVRRTLSRPTGNRQGRSGAARPCWLFPDGRCTPLTSATAPHQTSDRSSQPQGAVPISTSLLRLLC